MKNISKILNRKKSIFKSDVENHDDFLKDIISQSRFLILGGGGSIGQAVSKEIFKRSPKALHIVDISENNLVELVRDIRSSIGHIDGEFKTFAIDVGSPEFEKYINENPGFDYVFNLSALKHVRSEKDPNTLMRMIKVNIMNTITSIKQVKMRGCNHYFAVSSDKATNPVNMMGASKRIMEMFLMKSSNQIDVSTARFANVAFSDGSLLHGFQQRVLKEQPIAAPNDVLRYFISPEESGQLCLLSGLLGKNNDIFFPKLESGIELISFSEIAKSFLEGIGYEPHNCVDEEEARKEAQNLIRNNKWPCLFLNSDTTGEKPFEEFFTSSDEINLNKFKNIGVMKNVIDISISDLEKFEKKVLKMINELSWTKEEIIRLFLDLIPNFEHLELDKNLDQKM